MDTVTLMIVDIVGVLAQTWQKITVNEPRPSTSSPLGCMIITTDKEKDACVYWLCILYSICICTFYIEIIKRSSAQAQIHTSRTAFRSALLYPERVDITRNLFSQIMLQCTRARQREAPLTLNIFIKQIMETGTQRWRNAEVSQGKRHHEQVLRSGELDVHSRGQTYTTNRSPFWQLD